MIVDNCKSLSLSCPGYATLSRQLKISLCMGLLHYLDWLCHICHFYYVFALHFSATWSWLCCDQERNRACFQPTAPESEAGPIPFQVAESHQVHNHLSGDIEMQPSHYLYFLVFNRGDTVSRRSPIEGVRPSPYTTLCS